MSKQSIGEFIATLRKANGLTQVEVANKLGISNRTLSAWECGTALPDILLLPALADLYGVTVDEIIAGERNNLQEPQISTKSQRKLLQSKLSRVTTPFSLLTGLMILGMILFFVGLYYDVITVAWTGWQWWLLLLFVGLITTIVCFVILVAIFGGAKSFADEEQEGYYEYRTLMHKKFANCCYWVAILNIVVFAVTWLLPFGNNDGRDTMIALSLLFTVFFAVVGFAVYRKALGENPDANTNTKLQQHKKRSKKLAFWGLIFVGIAIVLSVFSLLINSPNNKRQEIFSAYTREEFVEKLECLHFDATTYIEESFYEQLPQSTDGYYLPLSACATNDSQQLVNLGGGFYARYYKENMCRIFCVVDMDEDGRQDDLLELAIVYRYWSEDRSWSVFVARYWNAPYPTTEDGIVDFQIVESSNKVSLYVPATQPIIGGYAVLLGWGVVILYYAIIGTITIVSYNKIKIKL